MHSVFSVVLLTVHMMLAVALIGVVLLQRSEGGMGGLGGGGMSGFMTTRRQRQPADEDDALAGRHLHGDELGAGLDRLA
jgi:hypothetical protein